MEAQYIIGNPDATSSPAPLGPLYKTARDLLGSQGMLAGPNVRFLPGTNPNGLIDCQSSNDEDPLQTRFLEWLENKRMPYPYAPIKVTETIPPPTKRVSF